jgi:imidazole glycerol-phosphate synthase subunit HisH
MIGIINYGHGNIGSIENALSTINTKYNVVTNPENLISYTHLILPGVGSFTKCMDIIQKHGWEKYIKDSITQGNYLLGICLGMQLLFDFGEEDGTSKGLGLINGNVKKMVPAAGEALPHVGWNNLISTQQDHNLFKNVSINADYYFDHSYECIPKKTEIILSETNYGVNKKFVSIIGDENIYGIQFHPEKSPPNGLHLLKNFTNISLN